MPRTSQILNIAGTLTTLFGLQTTKIEALKLEEPNDVGLSRKAIKKPTEIRESGRQLLRLYAPQGAESRITHHTMFYIHRELLGVMVCSILTMSVLADQCNYKECYCIYGQILCVNLKLTQIPPLAVTTVTEYTILNLNSNQITIIPSGSLPLNLTEVHLEDNPTTVIENAAFNGSTSTLQQLYFSSALFTRIPDALRHLTSLKTLSIQDTNVLDWNEDTLKNFSQTLESLSLENVGFATWPAWINDFSHLTELSVDSNSISSIPDDGLDQVINSLTSLSIVNNSLTSVPKAISKLVSLKELYLQKNQIVNVSWLPFASPLSTLWLNNNLITDANLLSNALSHFANSLIFLTIKVNKLTALPDFSFLTQVATLDFSDNEISDPLSGAILPTIFSIDLRHNSLTAIPHFMATLQTMYILVLPWNNITDIHGTDFPPLVGVVDLGFNLISELTDTSLPQNSKITSLILISNPIIKISNLAFTNLTHLTYLNLENSILTRLPLALASLVSLSAFFLTGSNDLVCTCAEKGLQQWVLSMQEYNVRGSCGDTTIFNFFSKLSPTCP